MSTVDGYFTMLRLGGVVSDEGAQSVGSDGRYLDSREVQ
jgi:hypothetical protein